MGTWPEFSIQGIRSCRYDDITRPTVPGTVTWGGSQNHYSFGRYLRSYAHYTGSDTYTVKNFSVVLRKFRGQQMCRKNTVDFTDKLFFILPNNTFISTEQNCKFYWLFIIPFTVFISKIICFIRLTLLFYTDKITASFYKIYRI